MKSNLLKAIFFIAVVFLSFNYIYSQKLPTNNLDGILVVDNQELNIMYRIEEKGEKMVANLFVPEQLLFAHKSSNVIVTEDILIIEIKSIGAEFRGKIDYEELVVRGKHIQGGEEFELDLKFIPDENAVHFNRPQEPKEPFHYLLQDHIIRDNRKNVAISGTLSLPNNIDKFPLVILITGSGPQDRNQTIAGHKPFLVISDYLTRNGIAVFRYDERGVGKSTGSFSDATTADFTYDVLNIVKYFKVHQNINSDKIGLIGHSEGGLVAMKAAAKNRRDIAFIVSLAGPAVNSQDLLQKQLEDILRVDGKDDDFINLQLQYQRQLFDITLKSKDMAEFRQNLIKLQEEFAENLTEEQVKEMGFSQRNINATVMQMYSPWMRFFLDIEPERHLRRLRCPVLALFGGKDMQVNSCINHRKIEEILADKRNQKYQIHTFPELNHLFQTAETGAINEYVLIEETFSPKALKKIKDFIILLF